jgi:hypothetical protein
VARARVARTRKSVRIGGVGGEGTGVERRLLRQEVPGLRVVTVVAAVVTSASLPLPLTPSMADAGEKGVDLGADEPDITEEAVDLAI